MNARIDNEWVRCGKCGHKLAKQIGDIAGRRCLPALEIKCHSCKTVNYVYVGGTKEANKNG